MAHTKECLADNTTAECTNCRKRFAIIRTEGVNYNCGICDTGIDLFFDEDKEKEEQREKARKEYERGMEFISLTFTDQNLRINGRRKHIEHICNLIGQHPFK